MQKYPNSFILVKKIISTLILFTCWIILWQVIPTSSSYAQSKNEAPTDDNSLTRDSSPIGDNKAGVIALPPPFNDYYYILSDLGADALSDGKVLGAFALALASKGHFYNAWQFSENIYPVIDRAKTRLDLVSFLVTAGNRQLARDAIESAANILLKTIPQGKKFNPNSVNNLTDYPLALERLVILETDFFGRQKVLNRIANIRNPTVFSLMLTYYINLISREVIGFSDENKNIPGALLDVIYNKLQTIKDRERYVDNLLTLASAVRSKNQPDVVSESKLNQSFLIDEVVGLLTSYPYLINKKRQYKLVNLLAKSNKLPVATKLISEISDPKHRASLMLLIAQELSKKNKKKSASSIYNLAIKIAKSKFSEEESIDFIESSVRSMVVNGLWASGYSTIISEKNETRRATLAAAMAQELLILGQDTEIDKLWVYITTPNLRAATYLQAAELKFKSNKINDGFDYLSRIYLETDFSNEDGGINPEIITKSLNLSFQYGTKEQLASDFDRALESLKYTKNPVKRLYSETLILQLHSRRSKIKSQESFERAKEILVNMWQYRSNPYYPVTVVSLIHLLAYGGETTLAITQASAMWIDPSRPETRIAKQQAIAYALEETLKQNKIDLARRSLTSINNPIIARKALVFLLLSIAGTPTSPELTPDNL